MLDADTPALPAAPAALPPGVALGIAAMVSAALAMSISPSLVRLADVGPFASAFWRVALALPVLWAWMRAEEAQAPAGAPRARFTRPTLLAGLVFAGDLFFWHLAVMKTTIANATFFATCAPIWVVLFGWLLLGQRVGGPVLSGLGLCVLGGAALVAQSLAFDPAHAVGDGLGIVTGVFFGLYFLAVGAARVRTGAARVTFEMSVVTALLLFAAALLLEPHLLPRSAYGWAVLLALALVSHAGGQGLLSVALGRLPAAFSSLVIFLEAVAAAGIAWAVLGEAVTPVQAAGGVVILAGIWIARPRPSAAVAP
ncbi:DMT family transporter [Lichenibacterium dinghuense]|uniref:DMT family transporter n=1 Tax=Lichenibacterium dinghuense TaxID=2895977 RepID=UPI00272E73C4|nr:DMT family transporter [Lichenibacterium sp. 6Y81]